MKTKTRAKAHPKTNAAPPLPPSEDDIRDYAYHLYEQSGRVPGHDLEHWLEAKACLEANIPKHRARTRLHHHRNPRPDAEPEEAMVIVTLDAERMPLVEPPAPAAGRTFGGGVVVLGAPPA